jgi:hypothetical protein
MNIVTDNVTDYQDHFKKDLSVADALKAIGADVRPISLVAGKKDFYIGNLASGFQRCQIDGDYDAKEYDWLPKGKYYNIDEITHKDGLTFRPNHVGHLAKTWQGSDLFFTEDDKRSLSEQIKQSEYLKSLGIPIVLRLFSGSSSYHLFIRTADTVTDSTVWRRLERKLLIVADGDLSIETLERQMRFPWAKRFKNNQWVEQSVEEINHYNKLPTSEKLETILDATGLFPCGLSDKQFSDYKRWINKGREGKNPLLSFPEPSKEPKKKVFDSILNGENNLIDCVNQATDRLGSDGFTVNNLESFQGNKARCCCPFHESKSGNSAYISLHNGVYLFYCRLCTPKSIDSFFFNYCIDKGIDPDSSNYPKGKEWAVYAKIYCDRAGITVPEHESKLEYQYKNNKKKTSFEVLLTDTINKIKAKSKDFGIHIPKKEGVKFEGNRAKAYFEIPEDVHDNGHTGVGKTHSLPDLPIPQGKTLFYVCSDPKNVPIKRISEEFSLLSSRTKYGYYLDTESQRLVEANAQTPEEIKIIKGNCPRTPFFRKLTEKGHDPYDDGSNPICKSCPFKGRCREETGWYLKDRYEALKSNKIYGHELAIPRDFDHKNTLYYIDELSSINPIKKLETNWESLILEIDRLRNFLSTDLYNELDSIMQRLKELSFNKERWGLDFNKIKFELLKDVSPSDALMHEIMINSFALSEIFIESNEPLIKENTEAFKGLNKKEVQKLKKQIKDEKSAILADAYNESKANLEKLPSNILVYILQALKSEKGYSFQIIAGKFDLSIDRRFEYSLIFQNSHKNIVADATSTTEDIKFTLGIDRPMIAMNNNSENHHKNLNVDIIKTKGMGSINISDRAANSCNLLINTLKETYGDNTKVIGHKSWLLPKIYKKKDEKDNKNNRTVTIPIDGWHFVHSRASNKFKGDEHLIVVGLPCKNIGAVQNDYFALYGNKDGFKTWYARKVNEEILQCVGGRQRCNLYPEKQFYVHLICGDNTSDDPEQIDLTDLSWLEQLGVTVTVRSAFEVNPEAGNENQATRYQIIKEAIELRKQGLKATQKAIGEKLEMRQSGISQSFSRAGVSLKDVIKMIDDLLQKNITAPYKEDIRTSDIFEQVKVHWPELWDLTLEDLAEDAIHQIVENGWSEFQNYIQNFHDPIQVRFLMALVVILQNDDDFLTEILQC